MSVQAERWMQGVRDRHQRAVDLAARTELRVGELVAGHRISYRAAYELEARREEALAHPGDVDLWHSVPWHLWGEVG